MTTEQKYTSRKLSEALRDAGAKQESEYCWRQGATTWILWPRDSDGFLGICESDAAAFDCAELLERLPTRIEGRGHQQHWWFHMIKAMVPKYGVGYARWIINELPGVEVIYLDNFNASADTPAEALGKLKLWCLEEGHCTE